jgi:hypothetical protein
MYSTVVIKTKYSSRAKMYVLVILVISVSYNLPRCWEVSTVVACAGAISSQHLAHACRSKI